MNTGQFVPDQEAWDRKFTELAAFRLKHGHFRLPKHKLLSLARWAVIQRTDARRGELNEERRQRLDAIGFDWDPMESWWPAMFEKLVAYRNKHGHCCVCKRAHPSLAQWTSQQRCLARRGQLSKDKRRQLDGIGFDWNPTESSWQAMFDLLKAYRDEHGHCCVNKRHNLSLAHWVTTQRHLAEQGLLPEDKRQRLAALGFTWDFRWDLQRERWQVNFDKLVAYRQAHGHCRVSKREDVFLAKWAWHQRERARKGLLEPERRQRLEALGFKWGAQDQQPQQSQRATAADVFVRR